MDIVLYILGGILMLLGLIGALVPILPGPPLSFIGLLLFHFTEPIEFSTSFLVTWAIIALAVTLLDYVIPMWGTKKFGGTKMGVRGATIGLIVGIFFFPPIGLILGPFVGAMIGELMQNSDDFTKALKSGMGSLIGFLLGTGLKLGTSLIMIVYLLQEWI